jgi:hypothetical protein
MIRFSLHTQIYRPCKQVFNFVATPENDFQWQYGTMTSDQISQGEIGPGALFRVVGHFMGRRIESTYEVTEFTPSEKYGFKSRSGPVDSCTLYTFEIIRGCTQMTMTSEVHSEELVKTNEVLIGKKMKKQSEQNLALLKGLLEADRVKNK